MLKITASQFAALSSASQRGFLVRAQEHLAKAFSRIFDEAAVGAMIEKGKSEGIEAERNLMKYMLVLIAANPKNPLEPPGWVADGLDVWGDEDVRIHFLMREARLHPFKPRDGG